MTSVQRIHAVSIDSSVILGLKIIILSRSIVACRYQYSVHKCKPVNTLYILLRAKPLNEPKRRKWSTHAPVAEHLLNACVPLTYLQVE
jgi:hypothetical protein